MQDGGTANDWTAKTMTSTDLACWAGCVDVMVMTSLQAHALGPLGGGCDATVMLV